MSRHRAVIAALAVVVLAGVAAPAAAGPPAERGRERAEERSGGRAGPKPKKAKGVRAGVAVVDATWHVGAAAGQYATNGTFVGAHGADPSHHSIRRESSYGIHSRSDVRALVVEGADGKRWALVTNDLYIPQDLVNRRVAAILAERDQRIALGLARGHRTGITESNMTVSVTHSHSSPYYSTPSWGVWAFQDVFDIRFFEYVAQRMADAVVEATAPASMAPVRMGAATVPFDRIQRHSYGPDVADDGTPAGYPETDNDKTVSVVRFDDVSDESAPRPLATWVVFGLHPEMLDGNNLLTGEYVGAMSRMVDRELGGVTLFSQNNTGTAEPAREGRAHPPQARAEFSHKEYAQMERAARLLADAVEQGWQAVGDPAALPAGGRRVPFEDRFAVAVEDLRFAPPNLRLTSSVSNCRAEQAFKGRPPVPLAGLPDCEHPVEAPPGSLPFDPGVVYDDLREAGVPVPDNVPAPSYTGLQETVQVHLQAVRLGDLGITVCPCEQWADQSRNIKTRLDKVDGNLWIGFDWTKQDLPPANPRSGPEPADWCERNADGTWSCARPSNPATDLPPVSDLAYRRMVAQINNPACDERGCWDDLRNSLQAETDPADPDDIWGNYRHEELTEHGYDMVIPVGMSNDYWGYIATYREFQGHDHYRKALTGLGPHSSDFLATRLTRMAASLNGGPEVTLTPKDVLYQGDDVHQRARATFLGEVARHSLPAYEATLPADAGAPRVLTQPQPLQRFGAAKVTWVGGSNWFDLPAVVVERREGGVWVPYGDMRGEVQALVRYPQPGPDMALWRAGQFEWKWEATFEAFASDLTMPDASGTRGRATPPGEYRFVIDGVKHAGAGARQPYHLESAPFTVSPWEGVRVEGLAADAASDTVTFSVRGVTVPGSSAGPIDYPDTYTSPFRFIEGGRDVVTYAGGHREEFCFECTFRPWADAGPVAAAAVRVGDGPPVPASCDAAGRCAAVLGGLEPGAAVTVARGDVDDPFGNFNGAAATAVAR